MSSEQLIAEVRSRVVAAAPDARLILFGSHGRGDADDRSDVDLLVIEPKVDDAAEESVRIRRVLRGLPAAIDVVVVSEAELRDWKDVRGSLVHAAVSEGRELTG